MRTFVFLLGLLALCSAESAHFWESTPFLPNIQHIMTPEGPDPKQSLLLIFEGLWEEANLTDPVKIIDCFSETGANQTLTFIGDMLVQIARGDAVLIPKTVLNYEKTISTSTVYCFGNSSELTQLREAFGVGNVSVPQIEVDIEKYILLHLKDLQNYAASGDFDFSQGQYKQVGNIFGQVFEKIVNGSSVAEPEPKSVGSNVDDLQNLLDGLFEQANLTDPTTITTCFNETTAKITLDFYGDVINDLSNDNYLALVREYHIYASSLPQSLVECIKNNTEVSSVYDAYGFTNETSAVLLQKYLSFGIKHHFQLLNDTKTINQEIAQEDYQTAGLITGQLIQGIQGNSDLISQDIINDGIDYVMKEMFDQFINEWYHGA